MNENELNKQWHEGFYGAMEMELREDADNLQFDIELYLSKEPLRMDMLIIKQLPNATITNEIGHIFRQYNVIEYKSPEDNLSIDDYVKTVGYASLYKAMANTTDEIPINEITITLVRDGYPRKLVKKLQKMGCTIEKYSNGIYHVTGNVMYPTQIVVSSQLDRKHTWLRVLTNRAQISDLEIFSIESSKPATQGEKNNINAIYQISVMANREKYEEMKRRYPMVCAALYDLMRPEIEATIEEKFLQSIMNLIATIKRLRGTKNDAVESIMQGYDKSEDEAKKLVERYW